MRFQFITIIFLFFTISTFSQSQKKVAKFKADYATAKQNNWPDSFFDLEVSISTGFNSPTSGYSDNTYASGGSFFELSTDYYFSNLGIGLSIGKFNNPTDEKINALTSSFQFSSLNKTEDWSLMYYGIGPNYKISIGNFFSTISADIGILAIKSINLESSYNNADTATPIPFYNITNNKTSNISYFSTGIKFGYQTGAFNFFVMGNYLSSFTNSLTIIEGKKAVSDTNKTGKIDAEDFFNSEGNPIPFTTSTKKVQPSAFNYGIGLSYGFHLKKTSSSITESSKDMLNEEEKQLSKVEVRGWNPKEKSKRIGKRKCLKNGGVFLEYPDGSKKCWKKNENSSKINTYLGDDIIQGKKRKCRKRGGIWVTNSSGSTCVLAPMEKLPMD